MNHKVQFKIERLIEEANALNLRKKALSYGIVPESGTDWKQKTKTLNKREAYSNRIGGKPFQNKFQNIYDSAVSIDNSLKRNHNIHQREFSASLHPSGRYILTDLGGSGSVYQSNQINRNNNLHKHPNVSNWARALYNTSPSETDFNSAGISANRTSSPSIGHAVTFNGNKGGFVRYKVPPGEKSTPKLLKYSNDAIGKFDLNGNPKPSYYDDLSSSFSPQIYPKKLTKEVVDNYINRQKKIQKSLRTRNRENRELADSYSQKTGLPKQSYAYNDIKRNPETYKNILADHNIAMPLVDRDLYPERPSRNNPLMILGDFDHKTGKFKRSIKEYKKL